MGAYEKESEDILGPTYRLLCNAAIEDKIDEQKMKDISSKLHPTVGGKHRQRKRSGECEMRAVISDWYQEEMFDMTRDNALHKLVIILEDPSVELKPLAKEIKKVITKDQENSTSLNDIPGTADRVSFTI